MCSELGDNCPNVRRKCKKCNKVWYGEDNYPEEHKNYDGFDCDGEVVRQEPISIEVKWEDVR